MPEQGTIAAPWRVLVGAYGFIVTILALWFGILGWFFVSLDGVVGAVWFVGSALTSAAAAVCAVYVVLTGERPWLRRTGWATLLLIAWIAAGGAIVSATD